jgi:site-specific recombinase XerD
MKFLFNKTSVESAAVGTHQDSKVPGLVLNVTATSRRFGIYVWCPRTQKPLRQSIGPWPAFNVELARAKATELIYAIKRAEPVEGTKPKSRKLGDIADDHEKSLRATGARHPDHFSVVLRLGCDDWRGRAADSITRDEVVERHNEIAGKRGKHAAARWVKALRAVYRSADLVCPATKVRIAPPSARARIASEEEMKRLREVLARQEQYHRDFFMLSILTGARRSNVSAMRFEDVVGDVWTIPAADAKAGKAIVLPLLPEATSIIEARREVLKTGFVFPSSGETGRLTHTWDRWSEIRREAGVDDLTQHDLRRTFISRLAENGVHPSVAAKLAGHSNVTTTLKHYTVVGQQQMRDALSKL